MCPMHNSNIHQSIVRYASQLMLLVAQASQLCESGRNVLEPVGVVMRNCSNLWHLLKVQLIPYFMALHDHGMDERSMQLLLLEIPACHPISQTAKDTFFPVYKALSASTPFTGNSLPQVSRILLQLYKILCRAPFSAYVVLYASRHGQPC